MSTQKALNVRIPVDDGIYLTGIAPGDKLSLVRLLNDPEIYERTLRIPYPYTETEAEGFLAIVERTTAQHGHPVHFAIRNSAGDLIGGIGFEGLVHGHRAEMGYWLGHPYWGQGIMTDVVRAACPFAMEQWQLIRIEAHVFEFNVASARVLEKNGFRREGQLQKYIKKAGRYFDSRLYALVR